MGERFWFVKWGISLNPRFVKLSSINQENTQTGTVTEGQSRNEVPASFADMHLVGCRGSRVAEQIRDHFRGFFMGPGALSWQEHILK